MKKGLPSKDGWKWKEEEKGREERGRKIVCQSLVPERSPVRLSRLRKVDWWLLRCPERERRKHKERREARKEGNPVDWLPIQWIQFTKIVTIRYKKWPFDTRSDQCPVVCKWFVVLSHVVGGRKRKRRKKEWEGEREKKKWEEERENEKEEKKYEEKEKMKERNTRRWEGDEDWLIFLGQIFEQ